MTRTPPAALATLGLLAVVATVFPHVVGALDLGYLTGTATRVLIYAMAAISLDLILGFGGMVSFGHAAYLGIGAYVVGILSFHGFEDSTLFGLPGTTEALVSWPAAVLVSALFALAIGALSLRTAGVYFIMITLAFAQMLYFLFVSLERYGGDDGLIMYAGRNGVPGLDLYDEATLYYITLAALVGFFLLCRSVVQSRFGAVLQGCRQNERRMVALGVSPYRYKLVAFVIAGAGAGLAGALYANHTEFVSPAVMHWTRSGDIMIMVILGGMGTLVGPILGAIAFLLLEDYLPALFDLVGLGDWREHWRIVFGPMLILVVLFARRGIYGLLAGRGD